MPVHSNIRAVFAHFQNLNLLSLVQDLRFGQTAWGDWSDGALLCPVAHGLPAGSDVWKLRQSTDLARGCAYAASRLGADAQAVLRFVESWDEEVLSATCLLQQLQELWDERLADAVAVQDVLCASEQKTDMTCVFA